MYRKQLKTMNLEKNIQKGQRQADRYGKEIIERYIKEAGKSDKETIAHLKALVENKRLRR